MKTSNRRMSAAACPAKRKRGVEFAKTKRFDELVYCSRKDVNASRSSFIL